MKESALSKPKTKPTIAWLPNVDNGKTIPDSQDYWDVNWLRVTVHCGAEDSDVWVSGSIVHLSELKSLQEDLEKLSDSLNGNVILNTMEPNLKLKFEAKIKRRVQSKSPSDSEPLNQTHSYLFETKHDNHQKFYTRN